MESADALRHAVLRCIKTRNHPVFEVRDEALAEMADLLEDVVRERLTTSNWRRVSTTSARGASFPMER
jgi:hypothetical protein